MATASWLVQKPVREYTQCKNDKPLVYDTSELYAIIIKRETEKGQSPEQAKKLADAIIKSRIRLDKCRNDRKKTIYISYKHLTN